MKTRIWEKVIEKIKNRIKFNRVLNFNQVRRDLWVVHKASLLPKGSKILDVGAGSCPYRHLFQHCDYKTQDFQRLPSDLLRGHRGYGNLDYCCDASNIPVPDKSFDAILCTEVLEHVPEPIKVIKEFARVLNPGGTLILTAPLGSGIHQAPYHYYGGFTPYWYEKFLKESGFEKIVVEPNGGFFKHYGQESFRFFLFLAPWQGRKQLIWFPFWLLSFPWFALICPLLGYWLDNLDREKGFTIGYHVLATRSY
ncbi:MAG: class I SAM-dependent methyltransferase [Nitrospiria bacterium]